MVQIVYFLWLLNGVFVILLCCKVLLNHLLFGFSVCFYLYFYLNVRWKWKKNDIKNMLVFIRHLFFCEEWAEKKPSTKNIYLLWFVLSMMCVKLTCGFRASIFFFALSPSLASLFASLRIHSFLPVKPLINIHEQNYKHRSWVLVKANKI